MKAMLLAAGLGTRLRPLTNTVPKCLVDINGTPLLGIWLEMLKQAGIGPNLINLHYLPDVVREYVSANYPDNETVYEEELLGTGGTLLKNRAFFGDEPVMLVHADNLSAFDMRAFARAHAERPVNCPMTMMLFRSPTPWTCGIVDLDDQGRVVDFHEKVENPPGDLANGAVYIVEPEMYEMLASFDRPFVDFSTDIIPGLMGRINTFVNDVYHRDIGNMESYNAALQEWAALERD